MLSDKQRNAYWDGCNAVFGELYTFWASEFFPFHVSSRLFLEMTLNCSALLACVTNFYSIILVNHRRPVSRYPRVWSIKITSFKLSKLIFASIVDNITPSPSIFKFKIRLINIKNKFKMFKLKKINLNLIRF